MIRFISLFLMGLLFLPFSPSYAGSPSEFEISIDKAQPTVVEYHSYYFGRVPVNSLRSVYYKVTNTGENPLSFDSSYISGIGFDAWHSCAKGLSPNETCKFEIRYWPHIRGYHSGQFELHFIEDSSIIVNLNGEAY